MTPEPQDGAIAQLQIRNRVARVLEGGFRAAVAILAIGLFLAAVRQEALPGTMEQPVDLITGIASGTPGSFIGLGIMTVILTPFVSTLVIAVTYFRQGNRRYAAISGAVLLILLASIGFSLL